MTARENLLAVLGHRKAAWVPCTPHILGINNYPGMLPESLAEGPMDRLALSRFVGGTVLYEIGGARRCLGEGVFEETVREGDEICTRICTPVGELTATRKHAKIPTPVYPPAPGLVAPGPLETDTETNFPVKSLEDYPRLAAYYDSMTFSPNAQAVSEAVRQVGQDGVVVCGAGSSPLYNLVSRSAGLTQTIYDLYDDPAVVGQAMDAIFRATLRQIEAVCDTDCDVVRITEDLDTSLVSPAMFEEYAAPALKAYADAVHAHGKLLVIHMCGRIRAFLPILREVGMDAIHCLCPPETGDTPMAEARAIFGDKIAIMARVDPPLLLSSTPDVLEDAVHGMIRDAGGGADNFMIILPCGRASLENLRAVIRGAEGVRF